MKFLALVFSLFLLSCTHSSDKTAYSELAINISKNIPQDSRVALKITSSDENGLPNVFLQKLVADFAGALVKESESKFIVLSRNSTEELWKEAVEFNNQDVDKITSSAEADISIKLSPKINEGGIDLTVTAYSLKEGSTGIILASTSKLIPMNVKSELGVDVKTLDKKIDQLSQLIDKDKAKKNNELVEIFHKFSDNPDIISFAKVYGDNCSKPQSLREKWEAHFKSEKFKEHCKLFSTPNGNCIEPYGSEFFSSFKDGFEMACELYDDGKLVAGENIFFDKNVYIEIINGIPRPLINSVRIKNPYEGIGLPSAISKHAKTIYCDNFNSALSWSKVYEIALPGKQPFFALIEYSSGVGPGSSSGSIELHYSKDFISAPNTNFVSLRTTLESGQICE